MILPLTARVDFGVSTSDAKVDAGSMGCPMGHDVGGGVVDVDVVEVVVVADIPMLGSVSVQSCEPRRLASSPPRLLASSPPRLLAPPPGPPQPRTQRTHMHPHTLHTLTCVALTAPLRCRERRPLLALASSSTPTFTSSTSPPRRPTPLRHTPTDARRGHAHQAAHSFFSSRLPSRVSSRSQT